MAISRAIVVLSCLALVACSDSSDPVSSGTDPTNPTDPAGVSTDRRLRSFDSGDEFYAALREALRRQWVDYGYGYPEEEGDLPVAAPETDAASDADDAGASSPESADSADPDVTGTNVQEVGVDEADRVKSDGQHLFVLNSTFADFYPVDTVTEPEPLRPDEVDTDSPEDASARSSFPGPQNSETRLRVLALQPESPDALPVTDLDVDLDGRMASGMYRYESGDNHSLFVMSNGLQNFWGFWGEPTAFGDVDALVARVDVSNPDAAAVAERLRIDGQIVSSRRIGQHLLVASRYYPRLPNIDPFSVTQDQWNAAVDAADLATVMPDYAVDDAGDTALIDPAGCFVADNALDDPYYTPDIIALSVFDLDTLTLTDSECYLGASETLYASPNAIYLATTRWQYDDRPVGLDDVDSDIAFFDPRVDTDIHQFSFDGGQLSYSGSGAVRGHLGWNQERKPWRFSEYEGFLRVATFSASQAPDVSPVLMTVLESGNGATMPVASTLPNPSNPAFIGKPGEQLYASRFVGDKAYLVTFRQTDPLYVVDLSDPRNPQVAGELEIEGYSDYLQPVGEDYLLGIGRDAAAAPDGGPGDGRGAVVLGVKLALFNVSDPANPTEVQSLVVGQRGTEAQALYNHRAITIQRANENRPTRVAFGINVAGRADPGARPQGEDAFRYYSWNYTGLHGFEVTTGTDAAIRSVPPMVVARAGNGDFQRDPYSADDRAVILSDSVYYVHGPEVYAGSWNTMDNFSGPR